MIVEQLFKTYIDMIYRHLKIWSYFVNSAVKEMLNIFLKKLLAMDM